MRGSFQFPGNIPNLAREGIEWLRDLTIRLRRTVDGHIGFGDGLEIDNMFGSWVSYTSNAVANTEDTVAHNLGLIPIGFLVFSIDKNGTVYKGPTAWTTTNIFLKCSAASAAILLFIPGPSNKDA